MSEITGQNTDFTIEELNAVDVNKISVFKDQISRKPDYYPWCKEFIQAMWDNPWNVEKFNFSSDVHDFNFVLDDKMRAIVLKTLSSVAQVEVSLKTFWSKLGDNLPPLRDIGCVMANVETVHNFAYEKLLSVLYMDDIFEENLKNPILAGRVNYLRKHTHKFYKDSKKQYIYALILFTIFVENISLFSQFYIMNWLNKNKNVLKNVNQQILYTKNEETIHFLVGAKIINTIREQHPELFDDELEDRILEESQKAIVYECGLIKWILEDFAEPDLDVDILEEFIKYRMNESLEKIGYRKLYEIDEIKKSKFWWFEEQVYGNTMVDFFNQKSVNYSRNNKSFEAEDLF